MKKGTAVSQVLVGQPDNERKAEFERVMSYVADRAWTEGVEEDVMAALFDVLEGTARRAGRSGGGCNAS